MDDQLSRIFDAHCAEADRKQAEFYNLGWAQGEDFIESKTDQGVLVSRLVEGKIQHRWLSIQRCVLCRDVIYGHGNNPDPLAHKGVCCDICNSTKVIPARLAQIGG